MIQSDFNPLPEIVMEQVKSIPGFLCGYIHGSYVYNHSGFSTNSYREVASFRNSKLEFSSFLLQDIAPDVDIVIVAEDTDSFVSNFKKEVERSLLLKKQLNYFLTLNVVSKEVFEKNIYSNQPLALKRILAFRKILHFGNNDYLSKCILTAKNSISEIDILFQNEYDFKKDYLKQQNLSGNKEFILTRDNYNELFPLTLDLVWENSIAVFPKDREKIVLPRPMLLKARHDLLTNEIVELE